MTILVTGGAGYIGSHVVLELLRSNEKIIVLDSLQNASVANINKIGEIYKHLIFIKGDIKNSNLLHDIFLRYHVTHIIHFAGLKSVAESTVDPLAYYLENVAGTTILLSVARKHQIKSFIFSSSAGVYGVEAKVPLTETTRPTTPANIYAKTKAWTEEILADYAKTTDSQVIILRYFNPVGADPAVLLSEDTLQNGESLMSNILRHVNGEKDALDIFGTNHPTNDGSCIRDFVHVSDLAKGHVAVLKGYSKAGQVEVFNLGTGVGYSVLQIIETFEKTNGVEIRKKICPPRIGDVAVSFANVEKIYNKVGWRAEYSLAEMCEHTWLAFKSQHSKK